jgi:flagellar motor switch/type III secretory pathway protein FliN
MDGAQLDPQEIEALREAFRPGESSASKNEAVPVALLREERLADRARPSAMALGTRWAALAQPMMTRHLGVQVDLQVTGAEPVSAASLREELDGSWLAGLNTKGNDILLAVSGPLIVSAAVRWLSGKVENAEDRRPSQAALRLFAPLGRSMEDAFRRAWAEVMGDVAVSRPPNLPSNTQSEALISISITVAGEVHGRTRLLIPPPALLSSATPVVPPPTQSDALADVPIELCIELGRTQITLSALAALQPGEVLTLAQPLQEPLPIRCGAVTAAYGKIVLRGEALSIAVVANPGDKAPSQTPPNEEGK